MSVPKDVVQAVVAALGKELHLLSDDDRCSSESRATVAGVLPVWWRAAFREQQDTADEGFWQMTTPSCSVLKRTWWAQLTHQ